MDRWPDVALELLCQNTDWLWEIDADGYLTSWTSSHDFKRKGVHKLTGPLQAWQRYMRKVRETRGATNQVMHAVRDRRIFRCQRVACWLPHLPELEGWLRVTGMPVYNEEGNFIGYRGVAQNSTGQMMAEHKIERLSAINRGLLDSIEVSTSAVFTAYRTSKVWRIVYTNAALRRMLCCAENEVIDCSPFALPAPDESTKILAHLEEDVQRGVQCKNKLKLHRLDGDVFWADYSLIPAHSEGGDVLVGIIRDISIEIAQRNVEEQRARLEAIGRLAGGMSHEINNLLQPAALNVEILQDELKDDAFQSQLLADIAQPLEQIRYIVRNTLQFARRPNGESQEKVVPEVQPIGPLVQSRLAYLRSLLPSTIRLEVPDLQQYSEPVAINSTELTQVLTNLCVNAAHAMQQKGVITISLEAQDIDGVHSRHHALPTGRYLLLAVHDHGCGMSAAIKERIFEPFFTTKPLGEGTGLGLPVVYGLVTGWGGTIEVESVEGEGSSFTVFIPQALPDQSSASQNTRSDEHDDKSARTLG